MAKLRHIPYGYCISDGQITVNADESEVVKRIYSLYFAGKSYLAIARLLQREGLIYGEGYNWNKNNVGRILHNDKYLGNDKYPCIVEKTMFNKAAARIRINSTRKAMNIDEFVSLKGLMQCNNCGDRMNYQYDKWLCAKCESRANLKNEAVDQLLNSLIDNPDRVDILPFKPYAPNMEIKRFENDIIRELEKLDCNEEYIKSLIKKLVDLKYSICDDGESGRQGKRIRELLRKSKCSDRINIELLTGITKRIIVQRDGGFFIILKNNQKIR